MRKKESSKLKIALAIVSTMLFLQSSLIAWAYFTSGPSKGSAIDKIIEVDDSVTERYS